MKHCREEPDEPQCLAAFRAANPAADASACNAAGISVERVEATIEKLNLNCRRLAEARLPLHRQLENAKKKLRESGTDPRVGLRRLAEIHLATDRTGGRQSFFTVARWSLGRGADEYLNEAQCLG